MENNKPGAGRQDSLGIRYEAHAAALQRFLCRLTKSKAEAEDLAQHVWLRLLESEQAGATLPAAEGEFRAYLFASGRNLYVDEHVRKHGRSRTVTRAPSVIEAGLHAQGADHGGAVTPEVEAERDELTRLVKCAVGALPESQRRVVHLWLAGVPIQSMARVTGVSADTVLSRKKYAFRRLRPELQHAVPWTAQPALATA